MYWVRYLTNVYVAIDECVCVCVCLFLNASVARITLEQLMTCLHAQKVDAIKRAKRKTQAVAATAAIVLFMKRCNDCDAVPEWMREIRLLKEVLLKLKKQQCN